MKKLSFTLVILLLTALQGMAQKLMIGERAPEFRSAEWLDGRAPAEGKPTVIIFFNSSNPQSVKSLAEGDRRAANMNGKLNVVVIGNESKDKLDTATAGMRNNLFVGADTPGKIFGAYDVRFVPFGVVLDSRGRVAWMGNTGSLNEDVINESLKY